MCVPPRVPFNPSRGVPAAEPTAVEGDNGATNSTAEVDAAAAAGADGGADSAVAGENDEADPSRTQTLAVEAPAVGFSVEDEDMTAEPSETRRSLTPELTGEIGPVRCVELWTYG